ncbi:hypothetical protein WR25_00960 [Diploscapter pachys]|uniref:Uncharacterized protein n=1 Tax=Diploscapter pachys TaxID=2018661 RepID=A0A2A2KEG0_9BILA|nr:hypothetical protein WR25_00960 [Diploscapter pachys]
MGEARFGKAGARPPGGLDGQAVILQHLPRPVDRLEPQVAARELDVAAIVETGDVSDVVAHREVAARDRVGQLRKAPFDIAERIGVDRRRVGHRQRRGERGGVALLRFGHAVVAQHRQVGEPLGDALGLVREAARIAGIERDQIDDGDARNPGQIPLAIADLAVGEVEQGRQIVRGRAGHAEQPQRARHRDGALDTPADVVEAPGGGAPHMLRRQTEDCGIAALERARPVEHAAMGGEGRFEQPHHVGGQAVARSFADAAGQAIDLRDRMPALVLHRGTREGSEVAAAHRVGVRGGAIARDQSDQLGDGGVGQGRAAVRRDRMAQHHADRREQRLAALQVTAEPIDVVGDAAGQCAGVAADVVRIGGGEERDGLHCLGAVDADVGGPQPFAQHAGARPPLASRAAKTRSVKGRGSSVSPMTTGMVDRRTISCPT